MNGEHGPWTRLQCFLFGTLSGKLIRNNLLLSALVLVIVVVALWMANTLHLSTAIARFERTHSISLTDAIANVHKFQGTGDPKYKEAYAKSVALAHSYSATFGRVPELIRRNEGVNTIQTTFLECTRDVAEIMASRIALLGWHPIIRDLLGIARDTDTLTGEYRKNVEAFFAAQDEKEKRRLLELMDGQEERLKRNEDGFSAGVGKLSEFVVLVVGLGLWTLLALFFAAAAWVSVRMTKSISGPVRELIEVAERIAEGRLDRSAISRISRDEVGVLAGTFQRMAGTLADKSKIIERIADGSGDFTVKVSLASEHDGFGKAIARMLESLNGILGGVRRASGEVKSSSLQVLQASRALSDGATRQAASLQEISSTVAQIASQAKLNAENAHKSRDLARETIAMARQGNEKMLALVNAIAEIAKSADGIRAIAKGIDDIAFQTNLLALNANVEAARAGRHGKGFAVVAAEVGNLSGRSAQSVKEAYALIEQVIRSIGGGKAVAEETASRIGEIVAKAEGLQRLSEEVSKGSQEQSLGIDQVGAGLSQVDAVTQANTASAEESAAAAQEMTAQAERLEAMVGRFVLTSE